MKTTELDGVSVTFSQEGQLPGGIPWSSSISLYRIAQESLRNALTHSGSTSISIQLIAAQTAITVVIADNGCGFSTDSVQGSGLGLSGMAERMKDIGGSLVVSSKPGEGATINAVAPLPEGAMAASAHVLKNPN